MQPKSLNTEETETLSGALRELLAEARKDLERAQQMVTALEELNRALEPEVPESFDWMTALDLLQQGKSVKRRDWPCGSRVRVSRMSGLPTVVLRVDDFRATDWQLAES